MDIDKDNKIISAYTLGSRGDVFKSKFFENKNLGDKRMSDYSIPEIKNIVMPIAKKHGVKRISLFGSRARGDNNYDSDYDFLITKGKVKTLWLYMGLVDDLEEAFKTHVDVVMDTSPDKDFIAEAESDGILLYEE